MRAYPSPHHIRRNFTSFPFDSPEVSPPFAGDPAAPVVPPTFQINTTITTENVNKMVDGFEGDFIGFQAYMESLAVSLTLLFWFFSRPDPSV